MPLIIKLSESDIKSAIESKYKSFKHDEKTPSADGSDGKVKVTSETKDNVVTPAVSAIIDSVANGVYNKVKTDLDAIKTEIDAMIKIFNAHVHVATSLGSPTAPTTTPMT